MLASLSTTCRKQIEVGWRTFALAANTAINERGTRLGTALEWKDHTAEVAVEREVEGIVEADAVESLEEHRRTRPAHPSMLRPRARVRRPPKRHRARFKQPNPKPSRRAEMMMGSGKGFRDSLKPG
ncbi:MAG: hypothetical protein Q8O64_04815 [Sideroxyarcus sp.]|nr:hypothetical protein [Sideroxyarcus sp.]